MGFMESPMELAMGKARATAMKDRFEANPTIEAAPRDERQALRLGYFLAALQREECRAGGGFDFHKAEKFDRDNGASAEELVELALGRQMAVELGFIEGVDEIPQDADTANRSLWRITEAGRAWFEPRFGPRIVRRPPLSASSGVRTIGLAFVSETAVKGAAEGAGWPPIMTLKEAASAARLAPQTLKRQVSEGRFTKSVKRGKPLLFWRDSFISELMKGVWH